jgi:hypothetical protein
MLDLTIDTNAANLAIRYEKAPRLIAGTLVRVFRRIGAGLVKYVVNEKLDNTLLHKRTGNLRRAIFSRIFLEGLDAVLVLGADVKKAIYARVHEYGGTIKAIHSANLAIPLDVARTAKGVARLSAREFIQNPQALGFETSFLSRKRTAIMGGRADGTFAPVFALKKQVTIPERSYLRSTIRDKREWILQELGLGTKEAVQDAIDG